MLLFLPETLGASINVGYYEAPEGFCCDDGLCHPEEKNESLSCFLLANYFNEVCADKYWFIVPLVLSSATS